MTAGPASLGRLRKTVCGEVTGRGMKKGPRDETVVLVRIRET